MNIHTHPEEYKKWLASLKVGDQVFVSTGYGWSSNGYSFYTIERTTATQLISSKKNIVGTAFEIRFNKSTGRQIGDDSRNWIEPITDKVRETNKRNKLESWASNLKPKQLSTECLQGSQA